MQLTPEQASILNRLLKDPKGCEIDQKNTIQKALYAYAKTHTQEETIKLQQELWVIEKSVYNIQSTIQRIGERASKFFNLMESLK